MTQRTTNRRQSPQTLIEQCIDIGVRLAQTKSLPTAEELERRYQLSQSTSYRRLRKIERYLKKCGDSHGLVGLMESDHRKSDRNCP